MFPIAWFRFLVKGDTFGFGGFEDNGLATVKGFGEEYWKKPQDQEERQKQDFDWKRCNQSEGNHKKIESFQ
jgi:hypothetical protein